MICHLQSSILLKYLHVKRAKDQIPHPVYFLTLFHLNEKFLLYHLRTLSMTASVQWLLTESWMFGAHADLGIMRRFLIMSTFS